MTAFPSLSSADKVTDPPGAGVYLNALSRSTSTTRRNPVSSPRTRNSASSSLSLNCRPRTPATARHPQARFCRTPRKSSGSSFKLSRPESARASDRIFVDQDDRALRLQQDVAQRFAILLVPLRSAQGQFRLRGNSRDRSAQLLRRIGVEVHGTCEGRFRSGEPVIHRGQGVATDPVSGNSGNQQRQGAPG